MLLLLALQLVLLVLTKVQSLDHDDDDDDDDNDDHLVSPGGGVVVPASTLRSISAPKLDEVAEARRLRASKSIKSSLLAPGPRFSRLASIIRKL